MHKFLPLSRNIFLQQENENKQVTFRNAVTLLLENMEERIEKTIKEIIKVTLF